MNNKNNYIRKTERTKVDFPLWRKKSTNLDSKTYKLVNEKIDQ